jgi:hypothetical protein
VFAIASDAHVTCCDTTHRALFGVQDFGAGKTGEYIDPEGFGLGTQPAAHLAQTDDVIAVVLEALRQHEIRHIETAGAGEEGKTVVADRRIQRCVLRLPVGNQFGQRARIHHRAGKYVRADFTAFFDQANTDLRIDLLEPNRRRKAGRSAAHNDDVKLHSLALHGFPLKDQMNCEL